MTDAKENIVRTNYELKDHLDNVRLVFSDMKLSSVVDGSCNITNPPTISVREPQPFDIDLVAVNNYYPFGMLQPGQIFSSESYRFGFNGKENDNEVKGTGNSIDFGDRSYDPRTTRWISLDPLKKEFPSISPYAAYADNPIIFVDELGQFPTARHVVLSKNKYESTYGTILSNLIGVGQRVADWGFWFSPKVHNDGLSGETIIENYTTNKNDIKNYLAILDRPLFDSKRPIISVLNFGTNLLQKIDAAIKIGFNDHTNEDVYAHTNYVDLYYQLIRDKIANGDINESQFKAESVPTLEKVLTSNDPMDVEFRENYLPKLQGYEFSLDPNYINGLLQEAMGNITPEQRIEGLPDNNHDKSSHCDPYNNPVIQKKDNENSINGVTMTKAVESVSERDGNVSK